MVRQADGSLLPTGGVVAAQLVLGSLDEETASVEFYVDCDADIILCYDWLRAHGLAFLYDSDEACLCTEHGCTSGRRVRLDLTLDAPASPATRLSTAEAHALLGSGTRTTIAVGSPCGPPSRRRRARRYSRGRLGQTRRWQASPTPAPRSPTARSSSSVASPSQRRVPPSVRRRTLAIFPTSPRWPLNTARSLRARPSTGSPARQRSRVRAAHRQWLSPYAALAADEALVTG